TATRRIGWERLARVATAAMVGLTAAVNLGTAPVRAADGEPVRSGKINEVSFAVFGALPQNLGAEFGHDELLAMGVDIAKVDTLQGRNSVAAPDTYPELDGAPATPGVGSDDPVQDLDPQAMAPTSSSYRVLSTWRERYGLRVYLRQGYWTGSSGWGYTKLSRYHNLNTAAVRATTKYPRSRAHTGGAAYRYETPVHHVRCSGWWIFRRCRIVETISAYAIVDYRLLRDGTTFGVVNAYCSRYRPRCPDWVKNAANV
ncbi:MAG: hypothetical protein ACRDI2_14025, partial [Chloroflexota bacterium]